MVHSLISKERLDAIINYAQLPKDIVCEALDIITSDFETEEESANYLSEFTAYQVATLVVDSYRDAMGEDR